MAQANAAVNLPKTLTALYRMRYPSRGIFSLSRRAPNAIGSPFVLVFKVQRWRSQPRRDGSRLPWQCLDLPALIVLH